MDSRYQLIGKLAIVTGGAGGIGMATTRLLARYGAKVIITDISQTALDKALAQFETENLSVFGYLTDSSNEEATVSFFNQIEKEHGTADILINNAYQGIHSPPHQTPLAEWERVIRTSLTGYFLYAREFGNRLILAKRTGQLVNISSIAGSSGIGRGNFAYSAAKGGVNQLTRELAIEWARSGIRVNAIQPCSVNTPGWRSWIESEGERGKELVAGLLTGIPIGRVAEPEDIASAVHFLVCDASAMITGVILPVDGGNLAFNAGGTLGKYSV
jgi:NAD(P)-dependent dehydrogenase (short-subunit alcohol dehydrogenase family)